MIIKAVAGGGGRGTRAVTAADAVEAAYQRCRSEAQAAFGRDDVYVEEFIPRARHVEVQILGDRTGRIAHLGERECSIQRRFQKIIEIAPAPALDDDLRGQIIDAAVRFAQQRRLPQSRHIRVSGRCIRPGGGGAVRVHRGERTVAGGAHGDRGSDRRRSGADPDQAGAGSDLGRTGGGRRVARRAATRSRPA